MNQTIIRQNNCPFCGTKISSRQTTRGRCPVCGQSLVYKMGDDYVGWLPEKLGSCVELRFIARSPHDAKRILWRGMHEPTGRSVAVQTFVLTDESRSQEWLDGIKKSPEESIPQVLALREAEHHGQVFWLVIDWPDGKSLADIITGERQPEEKLPDDRRLNILVHPAFWGSERDILKRT